MSSSLITPLARYSSTPKRLILFSPVGISDVMSVVMSFIFRTWNTSSLMYSLTHNTSVWEVMMRGAIGSITSLFTPNFLTYSSIIFAMSLGSADTFSSFA